MPTRKKSAVQLPLEQGIEAIKGAHDLITRFGTQVEPALYALLCDKKSPTREKVDRALKSGTQSAVAMLVPLLIAQFALAPAVAALVAAVAVQAIASAGQERLCEELAEARAKKARKGRVSNPRSQTPKSRPWPSAKAIRPAETKSKQRTTAKTKRAKK